MVLTKEKQIKIASNATSALVRLLSEKSIASAVRLISCDFKNRTISAALSDAITEAINSKSYVIKITCKNPSAINCEDTFCEAILIDLTGMDNATALYLSKKNMHESKKAKNIPSDFTEDKEIEILLQILSLGYQSSRKPLQYGICLLRTQHFTNFG